MALPVCIVIPLIGNGDHHAIGVNKCRGRGLDGDSAIADKILGCAVPVAETVEPAAFPQGCAYPASR